MSPPSEAREASALPDAPAATAQPSAPTDTLPPARHAVTAARLHPREWRARGVAPVVSSVRLLAGPWHDYVGVWIRGGAAGTLTVTAGDGALIARLLVGEDAEEVAC